MRLKSVKGYGNRRREKTIIAFRGINYGFGYTDGDLSDCEGVSSRLFPCLSPSGAESLVQGGSEITDIFAAYELFVVDGSTLWYDGEAVGSVSPGQKQFAGMGTSVVIFPDKKRFDLTTKTLESLEAEVSSEGTTFTTSSIQFPEAAVLTALKVGDAVTISGCTDIEANNHPDAILIREIKAHELVFYDGAFTAGNEALRISVRRSVPELSFLCEHDNRIWGVSGNIIYASKLGDPTNFSVYDGLSTDSYTAAVGTTGDFTGCVSYGSNVLFFKEHCIHKLYGYKPSNYSMTTMHVPGVCAGSSRSIVVANETLFYHGTLGVYATTDGVPQLISSAFDTVRFTDAVAGYDGERYFINMARDGVCSTYTFDLARGVWMRENTGRVCAMTVLRGELLVAYPDKIVRKSSILTEDTEWSATLCPFYEQIHDKKGYSNISIRASLSRGSHMSVDISIDDGPFVHCATRRAEQDQILSIPIAPNRCDTFRVRLSGAGPCVVYSIEREFFVY